MTVAFRSQKLTYAIIIATILSLIYYYQYLFSTAQIYAYSLFYNSHASNTLQVDILIPTVKPDFQVLFGCNGLKTILKYISNQTLIRRVILLSPISDINHSLLHSFLSDNDLHGKYNISWYAEENFNWPWIKPNTKMELKWRLPYPKVHQQLLKLFAMFVLPDVHSNMLIIDSDIVFIRNMPPFLYPNGSVLYNIDRSGLTSNSMLASNFVRFIGGYYVNNRNISELNVYNSEIAMHMGINDSYVTHHMLFQRDILLHLFEYTRDKTGYEFCESISHFRLGRFSEYQLYFSFMAAFHAERIVGQVLAYGDGGDCSVEWQKLNRIKSDLFYMACHDHSFGSGRLDIVNSKTGAFAVEKKKKRRKQNTVGHKLRRIKSGHFNNMQ